MSKIQFRNDSSAPKRTYKGKVYANYREYKPYLQEDFNKKCGYTNCLDDWFGGSITFQIDHFLPQSKYPKLKTEYANLIYSCSYVNRAKSNDEGNYLDPCDVDYNKHFHRNKNGEIVPEASSPKAVYMHKKLKLYLKRYSIIWVLEQLEQRMYKLQGIIEESENAEAKDLFVAIGIKYNDYKRYLRAQPIINGK